MAGTTLLNCCRLVPVGLLGSGGVCRLAGGRKFGSHKDDILETDKLLNNPVADANENLGISKDLLGPPHSLIEKKYDFNPQPLSNPKPNSDNEKDKDSPSHTGKVIEVSHKGFIEQTSNYVTNSNKTKITPKKDDDFIAPELKKLKDVNEPSKKDALKRAEDLSSRVNPEETGFSQKEVRTREVEGLEDQKVLYKPGIARYKGPKQSNLGENTGPSWDSSLEEFKNADNSTVKDNAKPIQKAVDETKTPSPGNNITDKQVKSPEKTEKQLKSPEKESASLHPSAKIEKKSPTFTIIEHKNDETNEKVKDGSKNEFSALKSSVNLTSTRQDLLESDDNLKNAFSKSSDPEDMDSPQVDESTTKRTKDKTFDPRTGLGKTPKLDSLAKTEMFKPVTDKVLERRENSILISKAAYSGPRYFDVTWTKGVKPGDESISQEVKMDEEIKNKMEVTRKMSKPIHQRSTGDNNFKLNPAMAALSKRKQDAFSGKKSLDGAPKEQSSSKVRLQAPAVPESKGSNPRYHSPPNLDRLPGQSHRSNQPNPPLQPTFRLPETPVEATKPLSQASKQAQQPPAAKKNEKIEQYVSLTPPHPEVQSPVQTQPLGQNKSPVKTMDPVLPESSKPVSRPPSPLPLDPLPLTLDLPEILHKRSQPLQEVTPFEAVPGPAVLRVANKIWSFIPVLGTQLVSTLLYAMHTIVKSYDHRQQYRWARVYDALLDRYGPVVRLAGPLGADMVLLEVNGHILPPVRSNPSLSMFDSLSAYRQLSAHPINFLMLKKDVISKTEDELTMEKSVEAIENVTTAFVTRTKSLRNYQNEVSGSYKKELQKWSLSCFAQAYFGKQLQYWGEGGQGAQGVHLTAAVQNATEALNLCETGIQLWRLGPTFSWAQLTESCSFIDKVLAEWVNSSLRDLDDNKTKETTLVQQLVKREELPMKSPQLLSSLLDTLLVNVQVASESAGWVLYHLARNPSVQRQLHRELQQLNKTSPISPHLPSLRYLSACIKETLRLKPPIPYHSTVLTEDIIIHGYKIPRGAFVQMVNKEGRSRGNGPMDWSDFEPNRWLEPSRGGGPTGNVLYSLPDWRSSPSLNKDIIFTQIALFVSKVVINFHVEHLNDNVYSNEMVLAGSNQPYGLRLTDRAVVGP